MSFISDIKEKFTNRHSTTMLVLTPFGKGKLEKPDTPEPKWKILNYLNENGPSTVHDTASGCGMSEDKLKKLVEQMPECIKRTRSTDEVSEEN